LAREAVVRAGIEHADPPDLPCLLCLARERHKRETQRENEPDQPHGHLVETLLAESVAKRHFELRGELVSEDQFSPATLRR
jgi:hypothetical protein